MSNSFGLLGSVTSHNITLLSQLNSFVVLPKTVPWVQGSRWLGWSAGSVLKGGLTLAKAGKGTPATQPHRPATATHTSHTQPHTRQPHTSHTHTHTSHTHQPQPHSHTHRPATATHTHRPATATQPHTHQPQPHTQTSHSHTATHTHQPQPHSHTHTSHSHTHRPATATQPHTHQPQTKQDRQHVPAVKGLYFIFLLVHILKMQCLSRLLVRILCFLSRLYLRDISTKYRRFYRSRL